MENIQVNRVGFIIILLLLLVIGGNDVVFGNTESGFNIGVGGMWSKRNIFNDQSQGFSIAIGITIRIGCDEQLVGRSNRIIDTTE